VKLGDPATQSYGDAVCTEGTIENTEPVLAARDAGGTLHGYLDELRVSNYAKRDFEMAASSQVAAAFAQTLGREVELRNQLPVGPEIEKRVADERRAFDVRGRIVSAWKHVRGQRASGDFVDRRAFDNLDRIGADEYPTGEVVSSTYDLGFTERALTGFGAFVAGQRPGRQTYVSEATSTVTGRIASLMFGNEVKSTYNYEEGPARAGGFGGELPRTQTIGKAGTSPLSQRTYTWDHVGNLLSATDPAVTYTASYTPDDLNRLRTATFSVAGQNLNFAYDYDSLGNLTSKEAVTQDYGRAFSPACGAGVTSLPHAVTRRTFNQAVVGSLCYDEAGRVVRDTNTLRNSIRHVSYFARGKTSHMSDRNGEYSFSYDGNGLRVRKIEPLGTTIEPFAHYREIPNNVESLYSGAGRVIARRAGSTPGDVFWFHLDHLGGTNLITDVNGAEDVPARIHYRPFGEALIAGAPQNDHAGSRLFTGKELDATGLYDFGARPYDPVTGRFLQPDDVEFGVGAEAMNRFTYSLNRPLVLIDPTGHAPADAKDLPRVPAPATLKPGQINVMPELELTGGEDPISKAIGQIQGAADSAMHNKVDPILHADKLLASAQIAANEEMRRRLTGVGNNMVSTSVMRTIFSQPAAVPRPKIGNQMFARDAEAMGEVAARRVAQGAPVAGAPESGTFGRLTINGRNYYSQNANNVNVRPAGVNAVSPRHMEGGAFGSAMQAGERAYEATLYTDRAMCGYCWGAVRGYMRELGIRYLRVVEPNGVSYTIGPKP
jgi:RHS repeat-associated protein